jgi:hypothetical protein
MVANKRITTAHKAWEGFDVAAMWVELDQLEASAKAARAAKAAKVAETAAAVEDANAASSASAAEPEKIPAAAADAAAVQKEEEDTVFAKPGVGDASAPDGDLGSAFEAPDIAAKLSDQDRPRLSEGGRQMSMQYSQMRPLMSSRSIRRMPSISQRNSLVAIGSGCVPVEDLPHLQTDVDVEVIEEGDEAMH